MQSPRDQHGNFFYQYLQQGPGEGNKQQHFLVCRKQGHLRQKGWQVSFSVSRHEVMHLEKKNLNPVYMVLTSELILKLMKEIQTVLSILGSVCSGSQKSLQNLGHHQDRCCGQDRGYHFAAIQKLCCAHTESCVSFCSLHLEEGWSGDSAEEDS